MVLHPQEAAAVVGHQIPRLTKPCTSWPTTTNDDLHFLHDDISTDTIPIIDLSSPEDAVPLAVKACRELGFFKVINHGVPLDLMTRLEDEATRFFDMADSDKEKASRPAIESPFGYGSKMIGPNGDVGWVEYLLLSASPDYISRAIFPGNSEPFRMAATSYIAAVKRMACRLLELLAVGLKVGSKDAFSRLLEDERSDSCFRLNHYPPTAVATSTGAGDNKLIGFGEHTDPQIISVLRSNNTAGLQILLPDGTTWLPVPPDSRSFFVNVGDSLQVMTNGRFKSVKHRVLAEGMKSRISMIYFGGPAPYEKIAPLASLMNEGEESLYEEFTWWEYKKAAYKTKLGENRLSKFNRPRGRK